MCPQHGAAPPRPDSAEAGERLATEVLQLSPYRLGDRLGYGGFGAVYAAEDRASGEPVAIKIAHPESPIANQSLEHEAKMQQMAHGTYVPAVRELSRRDDRVYLVSDLLRGKTLASELLATQGPMPLGSFRWIALGLLRVLEAVHDCGVVHADLKPENVFLCDDGKVRLIDFGLARQLSEQLPPALREGGTPEYMSPEQCEHGAAIDYRADVYVAGVVLYEMIAGHPPFWGPSAEVRESHKSRRPPHTLPCAAALASVIMQCLLKDPSRRFAHVLALRAALTRALDEQSHAHSVAPVSAARAPVGSIAPVTGAKEKRPVGLVFFESQVGTGEVTKAVSSLGGQLAHANGSQFVAVFGHETGDNPARTSLLAAETLVERGTCVNALVDVAHVTIQQRPDGSRRFLSAVFTRKGNYPLDSDPEGVLLTDAASHVLSDWNVDKVALRAGISHLLARSQAADETLSGSADSAILYGREELLVRLCDWAESAGAGEPTITTVLSEPGYGKSRVARALVRRLAAKRPGRLFFLSPQETFVGAAQDTLRELLARTLPLPDARPDDGGRSFFEMCLGTATGAQVWPAAALALGWISLAHPEVRTLSAAPGALRAAGARAAGESLRTLAQQGPVTLVLDDAQWADESTLDAIEYATLKEGAAPIFVCVLGRPSMEHGRPTWGARAARSERLVLEPLDSVSAGELARQLLLPAEHVPREAAELLYERTQGVPRLLTELIRGLKADGLVKRSDRGTGYVVATEKLEHIPDLPIVQWSASREVLGLDPQLVAHARLASVLGASFVPEDLEGVLGLLEREGTLGSAVLDTNIGIERLRNLGILVRRSSSAFDFRHSLLRETVYQSVPAELRVRIHATAYRMYEERTPRSPEDLPKLAFHAAQSGLPEQATHYYLLVAERAATRQAYLEAEMAWTSALSYLPSSADERTVPAIRARGLMRYRLGRFDDALHDFEVARQLAGERGSWREKLEILLDEAVVLDWTTEFNLSFEKALAAQRIAEDCPHIRTELNDARLKSAIGRSRFRLNQHDEGMPLLLEAAEEAGALGDVGYETSITSLVVAAAGLAQAGRLVEAEPLFSRCLTEAQSHNDQLHLAASLGNRVQLWLGSKQFSRALEDTGRVLQIAREIGFPVLEYYALRLFSEEHYFVGNFDEAVEFARRAGAVARRIFASDASDVFYMELHTARIEMLRGNSGEAHRIVEWLITQSAALEQAGKISSMFSQTDRVAFEALGATLFGADDSAWSAIEERARNVCPPMELAEFLEFRGLALSGALRHREAIDVLAEPAAGNSWISERIDRRRTAMLKALLAGKTGL